MSRWKIPINASSRPMTRGHFWGSFRTGRFSTRSSGRRRSFPTSNRGSIATGAWASSSSPGRSSSVSTRRSRNRWRGGSVICTCCRSRTRNCGAPSLRRVWNPCCGGVSIRPCSTATYRPTFGMPTTSGPTSNEIYGNLSTCATWGFPALPTHVRRAHGAAAQPVGARGGLRHHPQYREKLISILEASYLVTLLQPWHRNLGKRLVKTPKLYFLDTGLAAWLAGLHRDEDLALGSMRGALFETWVVSEFVKYRRNHALANEMYFWRDSAGNEIDLLVEIGPDSVFPVECKAGQTVAEDWFKSLRNFRKNVGTPGSALIYGGFGKQPRHETAVFGWQAIDECLRLALGAPPAA